MKNMDMEIMLKSAITCPLCGFKKSEIMPADACQFFYECTNCGEILKPKKGDCCVLFERYGEMSPRSGIKIM